MSIDPGGAAPPPPTTPHAPAAGTLRARAKAALPWLIALVAMTWVVRSVLGLPPRPEKLHELADVFRHVPYERFLVASAMLAVVNCAADSFAMYYTFRWFGCSLGYRELFVIRASTYILAVIQYYVGQVAILGYLHRRYAVDLARGAGWILFISGINMGVLVLLAAVGLIGGDPTVRWLRLIPLAVGVGSLVYGALLWRKPRLIADARMLEPLFTAGIAGHVKAVAVRLPHVLVLILWHFLALRWFGVRVPLFTALVLLPAVFFAAALPISVQGLGLSQAAAVYFFGEYAPAGRAAVLAYSLAMTTVALAVQVTMGLLFLPAGRRLGLEAAPVAGNPGVVAAGAALRVGNG